MKSYNSVSRSISKTDKEYYQRTPIENGSMNGRISSLTWLMGLGLVMFGVVITYKHVYVSGTGSANFIQQAKLSLPTFFTSESSSSSTDSALPSYRLRRLGYPTIDLDHEFMKYKFLDEMSDVIEPYAPMELAVDGYDGTDVYYAFSVCKSGSTASADCSYGKTAVDVPDVTSSQAYVACSPFDTLDVSVDQVEISSGTILNTAVTQAKCMYVRRELRSLTDDDLGKTMDALYAVYAVGDEEGQEKYGSEYHSYSYALRFHHFNAAWRESDHIHEGNGFAPQHIKMTNLVEKSMQMVDPSVSMPYWDFTIDHVNDRVSFSSDIFTENMFGSMTRPADLFQGFLYSNDTIASGKIANGRWAGLKAEMNDMYPELRNGYGYMRAPWNMNPSPYVSRYAAEYQIGVQLPSCYQHYELLSYTKRMEFLYDIQNGPHATTHALTGGTYGCDVLYPLLEAGLISDEESLKYICSSWVFSLKEFYRYNYITPYESCEATEDIESSVCGFTCNDDPDTYKEFKKNMQLKLTKYVPDDITDEGWNTWSDFVCEGDGWKIFSGDHLESASPADPSFWVIHPTLERLMHAKSMAGGFDEETEDWITDSKDQQVCDKNVCYMESEGDRGVYDDCCLGHYENDATLNFVTGVKSEQWGETNREILDATDPTSDTYSMPYMFDSFTWDHCEEDFEGLLSDAHAGIATQIESKTSKLGPDTTVESSDPGTVLTGDPTKSSTTVIGQLQPGSAGVIGSTPNSGLPSGGGLVSSGKPGSVGSTGLPSGPKLRRS
jgi:hypothetical protein